MEPKSCAFEMVGSMVYQFMKGASTEEIKRPMQVDILPIATGQYISSTGTGVRLQLHISAQR